MNNREAMIALNMLPKIGPVKVRHLLDYFGCAENILKAPLNKLTQVQGVGDQTAKIITGWESKIDLTAELDEVKARQLKILIQSDEEYPKSLRQMYDPPIALYVWGDVLPRDEHAISMVGSRKTTHYGQESARRLALQFASAGYTIVSGMALGIDTFSHQGAIAAEGRTIAVIGSGLGQIYPPANMGLAEHIASGHGAVISEFSLQTPPDKRTFPQRNRVVAAWSRATVVVECPKWSGSMITANMANEMGKPIYAVPGQIDRPTSEGCNHLIREGATLLSKAEDLLEDFYDLFSESPANNVQKKQAEKDLALPALTQTEALIFSHLQREEISLERIVLLTELSMAEILPALLKLEMKKLIRQLPGPRYVSISA